MDEKALEVAYKLFVKDGYNKSIGDFKTLISTNPKALDVSHKLFVKDGYNGDISKYKTLIGVGEIEPIVAPEIKKKEQVTELPSTDGSLGSENATKPLPKKGVSLGSEKPKPEAPIPNINDNSYGDVQPKPLEFRPFIKDKPILKPTQQVTPKQDLQNRLKKITTELVGKEEEFVVPELNYQFKDQGFKFEETGAGDAMKVVAPNGKETTINLDPLLPKWEVMESSKLKKFISENSIDYDKINKVSQQQSEYKKRFIDQKEIESANQRFNDEIKLFDYELQQLNLLQKGTPEYTKKANELAIAQNQLIYNQKELKKSAGKYVEMKESQGTYLGYLRNQLIGGITGAASGLAGLVLDVSALPDAAKKQAKNIIQPGIRESLDYFKDETTKEYAESLNFVGEAIGGLVQSLPAMLAGEGLPIIMAGQISDGLDQEMKTNPDFENVSELEKLALKTPMIVGGALLEKYGLRNVVQSKGLLNNIVLNAVGKSSKNTTVKSFEDFLEQEIKDKFTRGVLKVGAGGLAEFETGASQELLDITTKDIYNAVKEKKMFQTPETFGEEVGQVFKAGLQEAIGGFILSVPSAISASKGDYTKLNNATIDVLKATGNDATIGQMIETDLKMKVNSGDLTPEEAEIQLNDFRESVGVLNSINTEGMTPEQMKRALPIAKKLRDLKNRTDGKVNQTEADKFAINELKVSLDKITNEVKGQTPVADLIDKKVSFQGEDGRIIKDEGGKLTFETPNKIIELQGDEMANAIALPKIEVKGNNVKIDDELFNILSTNKNDNGDVVSVTLRNKEGQVITNKDADLATEISKQFKNKKDAIQEQTTEESVLRNQQPEMGLQEMGEGDIQKTPEQSKAEEEVGSVGIGEDKIKLDPDLANIDPILIAARNGDVAAQKQFEEMGLDWKQTTTYRFVGQSEVDVLLSNEKAESKRGMADAGIDVTSSPKVTTAATGEYRVTFKESFDKNNGLGKVRKKNEEDSNLERGRGYDINDVAKIERIDERGNVVETIYDQTKAEEAPKEGSVGVGEVKAVKTIDKGKVIVEDLTNNLTTKEDKVKALTEKLSSINYANVENNIEEFYSTIAERYFNGEERYKEVVHTVLSEYDIAGLGITKATEQSLKETTKEEVKPTELQTKISSLQDKIETIKKGKEGKSQILQKIADTAISDLQKKLNTLINKQNEAETKAKAKAKKANVLKDQPKSAVVKAAAEKVKEKPATNPRANKGEDVVWKDVNGRRGQGTVISVSKVDNSFEYEIKTKQGAVITKKHSEIKKKGIGVLANTAKKYGNLDVLTPRTLILRYFATGGKVLYGTKQQDGALSQTGYAAEDLFGFVSKNGRTYSQLYENIMDELQLEDFDQGDFNTMVSEILQGGKQSVYDEIKTHLVGEAKDLDDPTFWTYNELLEVVGNENFPNREWVIEQIGEMERSIQDELTPKEAEELDRNIEKYTIDGVIDWEAIANDKEIQKLNNEINEKQNTETESTTKRDSTPISQEEKTGQGSEKVTSSDKMFSASSRFKPAQMVVFEKPIIGKNGNKLISYQWAYEWTMQMIGRDTELKSKRVSDWTQAESSAETGRDVVHKFVVERKDGTTITVSSESIPEVLGYVDAKQMKNLPSIVSAVKTLAKQQMKLAIMKAQDAEYRELQEKYKKAKKPDVEVVEFDPETLGFARKKAFERSGEQDDSKTYFRMGDVTESQYNKSSYVDGKMVYTRNETPSQTTINDLESSWVNKRVKEDGGKYPQGLYELERRVERQEKKVRAATSSETLSEQEIENIKENESNYILTPNKGLPFLSESGNDNYPKKGNVQREEDNSQGYSRSIIGVWNKTKDLQFTGTTKVRNAEDVAHIMRLLENKSVEHGFAVHVDGEGNSHIQYLSIGGTTGTVIDPKLVLAGLAKFKSKKVYLVHNHPSGALVPSKPDISITQTLQSALGELDINLEHVIMDTYSNKYVLLDKDASPTIEDRNKNLKDDSNLTVHIFNEQKVISAPQTKVISSETAAEFIQQLRFTAMPKNAMLVLNQNNDIIGNYVFKDKITYQECVDFIGKSGIGTSVIFYGNQQRESDAKRVSNFLKNMSINVLDHIITDSNGSDVVGYYRSLAEEGMLEETQAEYGTNSVKTYKTNILLPRLIKNTNVTIKKQGVKGKLLNEQEAKDLKKEIISKRAPKGKIIFGQGYLDDNGVFREAQDIRSSMFNYDNPYASKNINGIDVRIADGLIRKNRDGKKYKTYLLYADGKIVGEFNSVADAKSVVGFIEDNLVKELPVSKQKELAEQQIKELSARIRSKKLSGIGVYLDFGITKTIYNGALEIAAREVEKGSKLGNAINKAIAWVDSKIGKKWNKGLFAKHLNDKYKVTLNGKEVEVEVDNSKPTAELINGFYSPLEAGINKSKLDKATGKEWLKRLIGETEGDELKWTGVADYLTENSDKVISKNDLLDYFKTNRIQVVEVVKGAEENQVKYKQLSDMPNAIYGFAERFIEAGDKKFLAEIEKEGYTIHYDNNGEVDYFTKEGKTFVTDKTKFSQYQLEGEKENYKEVLVTLPTKSTKFKYKLSKRLDGGKYQIEKANGKKLPTVYQDMFEAGKAVRELNAKEGSTYDASKNFKSTHFDEANILVHLRMNTRTDSQGNKVLFLEEVQSDWGQEGKREGFKNTSEQEDIIKKSKEKIDEYNKSLEKLGLLPNSSTSEIEDFKKGKTERNSQIDKEINKLEQYKDTVRNNRDWDAANQEIEKYEEEKAATRKEIRDAFNGIRLEEQNIIDAERNIRTDNRTASAPFVMDTNAWTKLGLKVALKEAVRQGVKKIAWTTGEQQNDRYDLRKQVDKIEIIKREGADSYRAKTYKNGDILEDQDYIAFDQLEGMFGKEIAKKVQEGESIFEGEGLAVGGKGMKGFYGSPSEKSLGIVGNVAKSLFKQEPKTVEIEGKKQSDPNNIGIVRVSGTDTWQLMDGNKNPIFDTYKEANDARKELKTNTTTQNSIDITPELKESVESGIPLFKGLTPKEQSKQRIEAAKKAFIEKSKNMSSGGFQALPEFVELIKSYIADGIITAKEFIERFKDELPGIDLNEKLAVTQFDKIYKKATTVVDETTEEVKKTIATLRVYEGNVRAGVKRELEKLGLTRDVENQQEAKERAIEFVDTVGIETALEAVRNNDVSDAAGAYVWNEILERLDRKISKEKDPKKLAELEKEQAGLFNEFSRKALSGGRFSSALADIYQNSDIGYNVENKIQEYRDANNGQISEEVEEKFRELDAQYKEVKQKLAEAEERAIKAEGELAIKNIQEAAARTPKQKVTVSSKIRTETDWIVSRVKEAQLNRPGMFLSATPASVVWDGAVKIVAGTIKVTGRSAEAIAKGLEHIVKSDWYKSLSDSDKKEAAKQFSEFWVNKETIPGIAIKIPNGLIRRLVEEGATTIEEVVEGVKDIIKEEYPDITDREIRDAITQYGKIKNLSKDEILASIRKIKRIGRIVSALEDVNNKKRPLRSGLQRDKLDAQERALNKELRELMKELPIDAELEAKQQKTALDATKQRITNQIEDLQREIDKGMRVPLSKRSMAEDAELTNLKEQRDKLKIKHDEIFKDESFLQAKRLDATKKASQRAINDLRRRLKEKDFSKKEKSPLIKDSELLNLQAEKLRLREEYDKEIYKAKLNNRTKAEKTIDILWNTWGLTRLLRATGEFSFVGIQGLVLSISNPTYALKSFATAMKFFGSESKTENWLNMIKSQEWYPEMRQSKLSISEPRGEATAREELFLSDAANFVWNILGSALKLKSKSAFDKWKNASPFKAFERAAVGYLDTMRVLKFLNGREMLHERGIRFENDPQAFKDLADVVNTFTGRASVGPLEQIAPTLTKVFFSPRNWASALKQTILFPRQLYKWRNKSGTPGVSIANKIALLDYSKFIGLTMGLVTAAAMYYSGDDDDETGVETDPTSSDFGKIKIGNTRVDPWGGRIQQIVFLARIIAGSIKNGSGEVVKLGTPYRAPTRLGLIGDQAVNKLAPSASMIQKFLTTHEKNGVTVDQWGNPYSITEELKKNSYPIYWDTVKELLKDDPTALDGLLMFYAFFGGGVNVYDKKTKPLSNRPIKELKELKEVQEVKGL